MSLTNSTMLEIHLNSFIMKKDASKKTDNDVLSFLPNHHKYPYQSSAHAIVHLRINVKMLRRFKKI